MFDFVCLSEQLAHYLSPEQLKEINRAYDLALEAHKGQKRLTGSPYITHPLEVAHILADMQMDAQCIIAALLHDVIEDAGITKLMLIEYFGEEIAEIVDGLSKITLLKVKDTAEIQAGNLRKMILAMAKDLRVILIKLADRLHNLRTLEAHPPEKRRRIAKETLDIYMPIAHRLGLRKFKEEFEEIGFAHLYPLRYQVLKKTVQNSVCRKNKVTEQIKKALAKQLAQENISYSLKEGGSQSLYCLYEKLKKKEFPLSELMTENYQLTILVDSVETCYRVLGIAHSLYKPLHRHFRDYIAVPKFNGYQSLHTTLLGPTGLPVEIRICTQVMAYIAEYGIAAYWLYKKELEPHSEAKKRAQSWVKGLKDIQKISTDSPDQFIKDVKRDLHPDEVYVFTPAGEILSLPNGATVVDFAYAVHTGVGHRCISAKIDQRLAPLTTQLISGQAVEVVTKKGAHPNPAWLGFVVTGKAKSNIRHWLKKQKETQRRQLGKQLIDQQLKIFSASWDTLPATAFKALLDHLHLKKIDPLLEEVGSGRQNALSVAKQLILSNKSLDTPAERPLTPIAISGKEGEIIAYANCCRPLPGDTIIGYIKEDGGLLIHRDHCALASAFKQKKNPEKYVFTQWDSLIEGEFWAEIRVNVLAPRGAPALITKTIAEQNGYIANLHVDDRDPRHKRIQCLLLVKNRDHLLKIMRRLRHLSAVTQVART